MKTKKSMSKLRHKLNERKGTHLEVIGWSGDGHSCRDSPIYEEVPNRSILEKARAGLVLVRVAAIIYAGMGSFIYHEYAKSKKQSERAIPHPYYLELIMKSDFKTDTDHSIIEDYKKQIKENLEKGYLKPGDRYYDKFKELLGDELDGF